MGSDEHQPPATDAPARAPLVDWRLAGRRLSNALLCAALGMLAFPAVTIGWASWQSRGEVDAFEQGALDMAGSLPAADGDDYSSPARAMRKQLHSGDRIARIRIPRIGLDTVAYQGSRRLALDGFDDTLALGPSHMTWTGLPGEGRNVALAGHRTTYTHPFWSLDRMRTGSRIEVETPYGRFSYRVTRSDIVGPGRVEVTDDHGYDELTLSTCEPRHSASHRLIVHARLVRAAPPPKRRGGKE